MSQYNESIWGSSSEIVRLNSANTTSPWNPEPQDNLYRSKYSVLNTPMNADVFPNNWDIDLSFATVNIDANCPWSFVHYINKDNDFIEDGGEMSLLPWFYTGDYGGLCGWISANPGTKLRVSTTSNSNTTPTMKYYQYLGQYNTSRQVYPHWTSYRDQIYMPIQRSTPIVKLGGRSIVGQIRVRCKNSRTSTSIQEYTLKEYCDTRYSSYPYIVGVAVVYAWRGQTYAILDRHSVIFAALSKDINIKVGSDNITVSSWDKELNGDNANGYNNIFGNMAATAQMDTSTDYLYPIFDERADIDGGWCATNYQNFGTIQDFHDEMMKNAAYHGTFFTDTTIPYSNSIPDWFSDNMYCGVIDQNGVTHGEYTRGIRNVRNFQYDSENVSKDSNVTPKKDGGGGGDRPKPDPDKNPILPGTPGFSLATTSGSKSYTITSSDFEEIWKDIYARENGAWRDLMEGLELFGSNPLNAILSYRWYPFTLGGSGHSPVILGRTIINDEHTYTFISNDSDAFYKSSGNFWYGYDKNFINSKHCKCRLWLPFYGFVELPMSQVLSKELEIDFQYNAPDDLAVWIISFGNVIYDYYECAPYIDIPITGDNSTQIAVAKQQQAINTALTIGSAAVTVGAGIAAGVASGGFGLIGDVFSFGFVDGLDLLAHAASYEVPASDMLAIATGFGAIGSGLNTAAKAGANIVTGKTQTANQIGTLSTNVPAKAGASATTFLHLPMYPYIQFYTNTLMETANIAQYKRTVGIACEQWSTIDAMPDNSLLSISNPVFDTSGMSENEVNALITALGGFVK